MGPVIALIVVVWAVHTVWHDISDKRRADRDSRKPKPGVARHTASWWAREAASGFPVSAAAWQKGWLTHKAAALQHKADLDRQRGVIAAFRAAGAAGAAGETQQPGPPSRAQFPWHPSQQPARLKLIVTPPPEPEPHPAPGSQPDSQPTRPTEGEPAPMAAQTAVPEVTYDQLQQHANRTLISLEDRLQALRAEQWAALADQITGSLRTGNTVGNASEIVDQIEQEMKVVQQRVDSTQRFILELRREHGGINDAIQAAPVPAAQPEFYQG